METFVVFFDELELNRVFFGFLVVQSVHVDDKMFGTDQGWMSDSCQLAVPCPQKKKPAENEKSGKTNWLKTKHAR